MEPRQWFDFSSNLGKRIISGLILAPVVLGILFIGGALYQIAVAAAALIVLFEWLSMVNAKQQEWEKERIVRWQKAGVAYSFVFAASLLYLRSRPEGLGLTLFTLMIVWATDIAAYAAGKMIGGAKLAESISPNKTWAGLLGGMMAAAMIGCIASFFSSGESRLALAMYGFLLGALLAVIGQAGDLLESWIKRQCDAKDSSNLIPGHGGVMDRVDGLVTVAALVALIALVSNGRIFG